MNIQYSIIIPTFNSHVDLKEILSSLVLIKNELDQVEILVIDDGSYDDTEMVVRGFVGQFESLNYHYQKNRGPAAARNLGAQKALGKYLIFIDDDCLMTKGCFISIKNFYKQKTNFSGLGVRTTNSSKSVFSDFNQRLGDYLIESSRVSDDSYQYSSSRCYSFTKESFWAINGHDEAFIWPAAEDRDFCIRFKNANFQLSYLETPAVINTDHLRLKDFIKQNFVYGLGTGLLKQKNPGMASIQLSGYKNMIRGIIKDSNSLKQLKLLLAFILAQLCTITGFIAYKINYDYKNRPPSVFPPRWFVYIEILKNFLLGFAVVKFIKNHFGSLSTGEELFSAGYLAFSAQKTNDIYKDVMLKTMGEGKWIKDKKILEIGPGSHLGVPIALIAQGAGHAVSIDKHGEVKFRMKESLIYDQILSRLSQEEKQRIDPVINNLSLKNIVGFNKERPLNYLPDISIDSPEVLRKLPAGYFDLIVSFNTMEHIENLNVAFLNMKSLLKQGGLMIHRVDAGSHYAVFRHTKNRLSQFLFTDALWRMMFSHRDAPTRRTWPDYLNISKQEGVLIKEFCVDELVSEAELKNSRRFLLPRFADNALTEIKKSGFILLALNE